MRYGDFSKGVGFDRRSATCMPLALMPDLLTGTPVLDEPAATMDRAA